jgi:hypothetical protein
MEDISVNPEEKSGKVNIKTQKVVEKFVEGVDLTQKYSLDELKKVLSESYKSSKVKEDGEKRALSKYNIFIQNEMAGFKEQHPDKSNKEIMSLIAVKWNETKNA